MAGTEGRDNDGEQSEVEEPPAKKPKKAKPKNAAAKPKPKTKRSQSHSGASGRSKKRQPAKPAVISDDDSTEESSCGMSEADHENVLQLVLPVSNEVMSAERNQNAPQTVSFFSVLPKSSFPAMAPLPAPIVSKNEPRHPERRILKVRRPSARERNSMYQKDNVDELSERMSHLNISNNVPKTSKTGGGLFGGNRRRGSTDITHG